MKVKIRREMPLPGGPRAEKYLLILQSFWMGLRYFEQGGHLSMDDPAAEMLLKKHPELVHFVDTNLLKKEV
jgi:hypothetical protein